MFCRISMPALALVGYLVGVAIHSFYPLAATPFWVWCGMGVAVFGLGTLAMPNSKARVFFIAAFACSIGILRFDLAVPPSDIDSEERLRMGKVVDVQEGIYGRQAVINIVSSFNPPLNKGGDGRGIKLRINIKQPISIGSTVEFTCALKRLEKNEEDLDRRYAANYHRSQARCTAKNMRVVAGPAWWDVRQSFSVLRDWTNARVSAAMPGDEGALIAGMLYGERGLSKEAQDRFKRAGLTHLIAVSGSNITIVASVIFGVLMAGGMRRKRAFWATTVSLAAYVIFAGFSASVARAAIMGWLVLLANHVGRIPRTAHVLLVSAALLNLLDPWMLAYDAGFALSFLATLGLMVWSPVFGRRLEWLPEGGGIRESAATTLGATIMTLPYMSFTFERASLAGLLTNVLAVPLVPFAMLFGAVGVAWGDLPGSHYVSLPAVGVAKTVFAAAKIADILPWLDIHMERADFFMCAATYVLLAIIYFSLRDKKVFSTMN